MQKVTLSLNKFIEEKRILVDRALEDLLPSQDAVPISVHKAMRYSVFSGGKRLRPILVLAGCHVCGGVVEDCIGVSCAIELIHSYSLVHDDLPLMDDDDFRRGRPSVHKVFGEDIALLAGNGLLTNAFMILSKERNEKILTEVCQAIGTEGMIGGQVLDMEWRESVKKNVELIKLIHSKKTAALIAVSLRVGAIAAGADPDKEKVLFNYGKKVGIAFQITDDIIDYQNRSQASENEEPCFVEVMGIDKARQEVDRLINSAQADLEIFGERALILHDFADYVRSREK